MRPKGSMSEKYTSTARLMIYTLVVAAVGVLSYIGKGAFNPTVKGFFCHDPSISYPYRSNTIDYYPMLAIGVGLLFAVIAYAEFYYHGRRVDRTCNPLEVMRVGDKVVLNSALVRFIHFILVAALGFFISLWIVNVIKLTQGQLRPHFLDVCKPMRNGTLILPCSTNQLVIDYTCEKSETDRYVRDSRMSFPSGHTSAAFFFATFIVIYLHARVAVHEGNKMLLFVILYAVMLLSATLVGISRIYDNKHHPADVIAGGLAGVFIAASILYCFKYLFIPSVRTVKCQHEMESSQQQSKDESLTPNPAEANYKTYTNC